MSAPRPGPMSLRRLLIITSLVATLVACDTAAASGDGGLRQEAPPSDVRLVTRGDRAQTVAAEAPLDAAAGPSPPTVRPWTLWMWLVGSVAALSALAFAIREPAPAGA